MGLLDSKRKGGTHSNKPSSCLAAGPGPRVCEMGSVLTVFIVTKPDQCPEGQKRFVRLPDVPDVAHSLPVGSRLNPFGELRKPWGLDPR